MWTFEHAYSLNIIVFVITDFFVVMLSSVTDCPELTAVLVRVI